MASQWFCKVLGQEIGPVGFREMAEMVRAGTLKENDPVRREGTSQWTRAREVIGLFRAAAKEPAQARPDAKAEPTPVRAPAAPKEPERPSLPPRRIGRRRALLAGGLVFALVLLVAGISAWRATRRARFPEPRGPGVRVVQEDLLGPLAAGRSNTTSIPVPNDPVPQPTSADVAGLKARLTLDFREDFETQAIDLLLIGGSDPEQYFSLEPAGLRVSVPDNCPVWHFSAAARIRVKGDFQITARYTILNLEPPTEGWGAGISLFVESAEGERAGMGRKLRVREGHVFTGYRGKRQQDGTYEHPTRFRKTSSDVLSAWLRLTRVGEKIRYQIADPGSERFVEIYEAEFPEGELVKVRLAAETGKSPTVLDAVWSYLDVQAEELVKMY